MKKVIISVCAIVIIMSASAVKAIPLEPESIYGPLDTIWRAIHSLQIQLQNIQLIPGPQGPQGIQGETGPAGASLKVYDANNQEIGLLVSYESDFANVWENSTQKLIKINLINGESPIDQNGVTFYSGYNCDGEIFIGSYAQYQIEKTYAMDPNLSNNIYRFEIINQIENYATHSQWATGLQTCIQRDETHNVYSIQPVEIATFSTPLRISQ